MIVINSVISGSPADKCGAAANDVLVKINGNTIADVLDYMFYAAETSVDLELLRGSETLHITIEKGEYDDLGLEFETFLMDCKQSCRNKCVFCFIDQMPPGMRESLYFKDDDARLSFLQGNYVTLTNLEQSDIDRIIKMKLNINVSVHTTDPELRVKMMNNRFAGEKLKYIKQLTDNGIKLNCQIVCCQGLNDGEALRRSLRDLGELMPNITSMAVVPVGLTKFRDGLYPLEPFSKRSAAETIGIIEDFQKEFLEKYGTRTVFASDEFYLTAERELPPADSYEEYPQFENGVGMLRSLIDEFESALNIAEPEFSERHISIATGMLAYSTIRDLADLAQERFQGLKCDVYAVKNNFFGESITVTGLLTAGDIISQLKGKDLGEELLISSSMLRTGTEDFLDDLTVSDVSNALGVTIRSTQNDGYDLLYTMLGIDM